MDLSANQCRLYEFIEENRVDMLQDLTDIIKSFQDDMRAGPHYFYKYDNQETPSIDIRLCIDLSTKYFATSWVFRTGLADYDLIHSYYCAASCITLETDPSELLNELINQLE